MNITNKYVVEAILFFSYVLFAMAWVGGTASMDQIMAAMELHDLASASFISGAVTFAKIVGTFLAAWIALKLGIKFAFLLSAAMVVMGVLTPMADSYEMLLSSRFLMGLGGALMVVYFNPIVLNFFAVEERPTVNGLNAVAFNVGTAIILWGMPGFNDLFGGWKASLVAFSIASTLMMILWTLVKWSDNTTQQHADVSCEKYTYIEGIKDPFIWTYALTYAGLLSFYVCLFTFYPKAGIVASKWVIGFGIIGTIAGIFFSRKVVSRIPIIRWSGLIQTIMVVGLSFSGDVTIQTLCAMVLGFFIFAPVTALVSIPHEIPFMTASKITVVFSLFWSISYMVATLVLWFFGKLVDIYGGYHYAFAMISVVSTTFFFGSFFLPTVEEKQSA